VFHHSGTILSRATDFVTRKLKYSKLSGICFKGNDVGRHAASIGDTRNAYEILVAKAEGIAWED
jgi:hypothetical protein